MADGGSVTPIRQQADPRFTQGLGHPGAESEESVPISSKLPQSVAAQIDAWVQHPYSSIDTRSAFVREACIQMLDKISEHVDDPSMAAQMHDVVSMVRVDNMLSTYEGFLRQTRDYEERIDKLILGHYQLIHNSEYPDFPLTLVESIESLCGELPEPYRGHLLNYCSGLIQLVETATTIAEPKVDETAP